MIVITCPSCQAQFNTEEKNIGLEAKCISCEETFILEAPKAEAEPLPQLVSINNDKVDAPTSAGSVPVNSEEGLRSSEPGYPVANESRPKEGDSTEELTRGSSFDAGFKTFNDLGARTTENENYEYSAFEKSIMPMPGWKKGLVGVSLMAFGMGIVFLVLGSLQGGFLTNTGHDQRFLLAGFLASISAVCYMIGGARKVSTVMISAVMVLAFLILAFYLPIYVTPSKDPTKTVKTFSLGPLENEPKIPTKK